MDDVETFVIIGNFKEIPVIVVSRSDLSAENGPPLETRRGYIAEYCNGQFTWTKQPGKQR